MRRIPEASSPSMKICSTCRAEKPLDDFYRCRVGVLGRAAQCKECNDNSKRALFIKRRGFDFDEWTRINKLGGILYGELKDSGLTQSILKQVLKYDPETGQCTWLIPFPRSKHKPGDPAGTLDGKGYPHICIGQGRYFLHRLAFLYMTGEWPVNLVDHINHNPADCRWVNLREATYSENAWNSSQCKNGVWKNRNGKWRAQSRFHGKIKHIGTFNMEVEAREAYLRFIDEHHGEFRYHSKSGSTGSG